MCLAAFAKTHMYSATPSPAGHAVPLVAVAGGARDATKTYVAVAGGHAMPPKLRDTAEGCARCAAFVK